jgi:hypothetical protein
VRNLQTELDLLRRDAAVKQVRFTATAARGSLTPRASRTRSSSCGSCCVQRPPSPRCRHRPDARRRPVPRRRPARRPSAARTDALHQRAPSRRPLRSPSGRTRTLSSSRPLGCVDAGAGGCWIVTEPVDAGDPCGTARGQQPHLGGAGGVCCVRMPASPSGGFRSSRQRHAVTLAFAPAPAASFRLRAEGSAGTSTRARISPLPALTERMRTSGPQAQWAEEKAALNRRLAAEEEARAALAAQLEMEMAAARAAREAAREASESLAAQLWDRERTFAAVIERYTQELQASCRTRPRSQARSRAPHTGAGRAAGGGDEAARGVGERGAAAGQRAATRGCRQAQGARGGDKSRRRPVGSAARATDSPVPCAEHRAPAHLLAASRTCFRFCFSFEMYTRRLGSDGDSFTN